MTLDAMGNPTGTPDPSADGSATAPGTAEGAGGGSGADLLEQVEDMKYRLEEQTRINAQLLSEKSNTEAERESLRRERESLRGASQVNEQALRDIAVIENPSGRTAEEVAAAAGRVAGALGRDLYTTRNELLGEIHKLRQGRDAIPGVPQDVNQEARELLDTGKVTSLQEGVERIVGQRALAGKWKPAEAPPVVVPLAQRPQPAARMPMASAIRSVPGAAAALPSTMTQTDYLALNGEDFERAFNARRAGSLTLTE